MLTKEEVIQVISKMTDIEFREFSLSHDTGISVRLEWFAKKQLKQEIEEFFTQDKYTTLFDFLETTNGNNDYVNVKIVFKDWHNQDRVQVTLGIHKDKTIDWMRIPDLNCDYRKFDNASLDTFDEVVLPEICSLSEKHLKQLREQEREYSDILMRIQNFTRSETNKKQGPAIIA